MPRLVKGCVAKFFKRLRERFVPFYELLPCKEAYHHLITPVQCNWRHRCNLCWLKGCDEKLDVLYVIQEVMPRRIREKPGMLA